MTSKLSEMDVLIHRLLDLEADLSSSPDHTHPASALSLLLAQFTQVCELVMVKYLPLLCDSCSLPVPRLYGHLWPLLEGLTLATVLVGPVSLMTRVTRLQPP